MRNRIYHTVNAVVLILTAPCLYMVIKELFLGFRSPAEAGGMWLPAGAVFTAVVLLTKAVRFYFIILEKQPGMGRFVRLHLKTTLVSLLIPFKAGELFRMYCFGTALGSVRTGFFLTLVDRYFDTVPLLLLLTGAAAVGGSRVPGLVWCLFLFMALATVAYAVFPSTYRYLNRFLIVNTVSGKGVAALKWLRRMKGWHSYIRELVGGREAVLILFSCFAWGAEYAALFCLAEWAGEYFSPGDFFDYINSVLTGGVSDLGRMYIGISSVLLLTASAAVCCTAALGRGRKGI